MFPQWMKRHEVLFTPSTSQLMNWVEWARGVLEKMFLLPVLLVTRRTSVTCGKFINSRPKHNLRSISQQPSKSLWKREKENAIKLTNFTQIERVIEPCIFGFWKVWFEIHGSRSCSLRNTYGAPRLARKLRCEKLRRNCRWSARDEEYKRGRKSPCKFPLLCYVKIH